MESARKQRTGSAGYWIKLTGRLIKTAIDSSHEEFESVGKKGGLPTGSKQATDQEASKLLTEISSSTSSQ